MIIQKYSTVRTINYKETTMEPSLNHVDKDYLEKDLDGLLNTIFSEQYRNNTDTKAVESKKVYVAHNYMVRKLKNVFSLVMEKEDESSTKLLHKILEAILMTKGNITATQLERVLCIGTKCNGEQHLALNAAFLAILGCREIMTDEAVRHIYNIMQHIRTSQEPAEHLEAINIYYAVIKQHPYLLHQLAQHHRSYLEYIREMAQFVRLKVPHEDDITQVKDLRKILDFLRVDHYAAITGHIYLPIVINRTNMAIDILTKRDMCYESEECTPQTTM
ncbi:hypothetical protein X943_001078 [Babesia divergens]|uniref:Uncharacterized protein n=1 Tax=Babesia divergens TaxID=32595 RepID=A0AAD9LFK7_BABDI|nr:hypothetical protein X943_001078 [Babesia divergens]